MLNRRQFLLGLGSGAMLVGFGPVVGCSRDDERIASTLILEPTEAWANSICQLCPSACGLRVRLANGHPVTVTGNPLHPVNRGGLCARGAASLQLYYDPDRLAGPIRKVADAVGGWAPIGWDEGIAEVAVRLKRVIAGGPGRVAVIRGDGQDISSQLLGRLVRSAGSDWIVDSQTPADRAADETLRAMHGTEGRFVYDIANADFLLSIDSGLLESASATMTLHRGFADMRSSGGSFVHAGPRMGVTGSKADEWVPIRPSTVGTLALGIAHMLIKEGYEQTTFLSAKTKGYYDWTDQLGMHHDGVRSWLLREFSPRRVAEVTGVSLEQIIRTAREFGAAQRPLAIGPTEGPASAGLFDAMAVHTLNAVVGSIDVPGGVLLAGSNPLPILDGPVEPPPDAEGTVRADRRTLVERRTVEELATWVLEGRGPTIEVLFVHDADPVFSSTAGDKVAEALAKIPVVVSTSPVVTDTLQAANLVLPGSLWIERHCDASVADEHGRPVVSVSAAAAPRRADTRNIADVVIALAGQIGGGVAERFGWKSYDELVSAQSNALYSSGVGDTFAAAERSEWTQLLERSGWRSPAYDSVTRLEKQLHSTGGWWDSSHAHGEWRRLAPGGDHRIDLAAVRVPARPTLSPATAGSHDRGLLLYVTTEQTLSVRPGGSLPYLQDIASPLAEMGWTNTAELNPETAHHLDIEHGGRVLVSSEHGEVEARAVLSPAIRPDVVALHTGGGRVYGGRYDAGVGSKPLELLSGRLQDSGFALPRDPTLVRVKQTA